MSLHILIVCLCLCWCSACIWREMQGRKMQGSVSLNTLRAFILPVFKHPYNTLFHISLHIIICVYFFITWLTAICFALWEGVAGRLVVVIFLLSLLWMSFFVFLLLYTATTKRRTHSIYRWWLCVLWVIIVRLTSIYQGEFASLLTKHRFLIIIFHIIGAIFGVGAATVNDVFFFKFLADFKIEKTEAATMHSLSEIIWVGLTLLLATWIMLYLSDPNTYISSDKFIAKMVIVGILIINGVFLTLHLTPRLTDLDFTTSLRHTTNMKYLAFASGIVSLTGWYTALVLGRLPSLGSWERRHMILLYASLVIGWWCTIPFLLRYFHMSGKRYLQKQKDQNEPKDI